jgi:hypothetical protein
MRMRVLLRGNERPSREPAGKTTAEAKEHP